MHALSIKNLKKTYKGGVQALKGISLDVEQGDFFGLLGENGAGKTTTIGVVTGTVNKTAGSVNVLGTDIDVDHEKVKRTIGVVPQEINLAAFESVIDVVSIQGGYYGLPRKVAYERAKKYLTMMGLWEKHKSYTMHLSGGMKRRVMIARALVHEPKFLILDEPSAGVDVELRRLTWEFLQNLNKNGTTIILTTHYLEEAEHLCNKIGIIAKGKLLEVLSTKEIVEKLDKETFILDVNKPMKKHVCKDFAISPVDKKTIEVVVPKKKSLNELFKYLTDKGVVAQSMRNKQSRLEQLYVDMLKEA